MIRTAALLASLAVALAVVPAPAQPKKPPPQFRPFNGVSPDQFFQSSVARWSDQLAHDLGTARGEFAAARVPPPTRDALTAQADQATAAARALSKLARRTADRGQLYGAFAAVETPFTQLNDLVARNAPASAAFTRAGYAYQQLAAAVSQGDPAPDRAKGSVARLAGALDDQADDLWSTADEQLGAAFTRDLDRAIRRFARTARQLRRDLEATGDVAKAGAAFPAVGQAWGDVVARLDRIPNLPAGVQAQTARIDGLYRRLGERVAVIAPQPTPPQPVPQPTPQPAAPPPPPVGFARPKATVVAIAAGAGGGPRVRVFTDLRAPPALDFFAYDAEFRGGARVSVADVTGDGIPDVVTAPGPGMPALVRVYDGRDGTLVTEFYGAEAEWTGGVNVAAADLTADGRALVAVAADAGGGPHVRVFDLAQGREVASFFAYPQQLRGGVRLAWTDLNGDGNPDLVTAPGPCEHGPLVRVLNLADQKPLAEFWAFDQNWTGGLWVAADRAGRIVCGLDAGGPPAVRVFDARRPQKPLMDWPAFPADYRGGVRVASADVDGDGVPDVVCAPGGGLRDVPARVFSGKTGREVGTIPAIPGFDGGAFVGGR